MQTEARCQRSRRLAEQLLHFETSVSCIPHKFCSSSFISLQIYCGHFLLSFCVHSFCSSFFSCLFPFLSAVPLFSFSHRFRSLFLCIRLLDQKHRSEHRIMFACVSLTAGNTEHFTHAQHCCLVLTGFLQGLLLNSPWELYSNRPQRGRKGKTHTVQRDMWKDSKCAFQPVTVRQTQVMLRLRLSIVICICNFRIIRLYLHLSRSSFPGEHYLTPACYYDSRTGKKASRFYVVALKYNQ